MKQQDLFKAVAVEKYDLLSREELVKMLTLQSRVLETVTKDNGRLRAVNEELKQKSIFVEEQLIVIKGKLYGKSSEKSPQQPSERDKKSAKDKKIKIQLPSLRYPNAPLIEKDVDFAVPPSCGCCATQMTDSGMTEDSEYLTVVPTQFYVVRQKRHKYRCGKCHGDIKTVAPDFPCRLVNS